MRLVLLALLLAWPAHLSVRSHALYLWDRNLPCAWSPSKDIRARLWCYRADWGKRCSPVMDHQILSCLRMTPRATT